LCALSTGENGKLTQLAIRNGDTEIVAKKLP
jgi:hypothetical protein